MISRAELNPHNYPLTEEQEKNQVKLWYAVNELRKAYGKPMIVTSGVRSDKDQARINPKAMKSKHLLGAACDFADPDGKLAEFAKKNEKLLEENGIWCENTNYTVGWLHCQILPYGSWKEGKSRFFIP